MAKGIGQGSRTKQIDVRYHHIREKVDNRTISVEFTPTETIIADNLITKEL